MKLKTRFRQGAALVLAMALTAPHVFASNALGSELKGSTTQLASGVSVTTNSLWSATYSDLRTEYYLTYTPSDQIQPFLYYGTKATDTATLSASAGKLAQQGYRVLGGINGGFFNSNGTSVGLIMTDGVIRSMDEWNGYMLGFQKDGTAFVDSSAITKRVIWDDASGQSLWLNLTAINAARANGGLYLYSEDFGKTTQNSYSGVDVVLEPVNAGEKPTMNRDLTLRVVQVIDSIQEDESPNVSIPTGGYVLSANQNCVDLILDSLRGMTPGTEVTIRISGGDPRWSEVTCGITGLYNLVSNGSVGSGLEAGAAPRTAIGLKADGSIIFYTIDGRQSGYSVGATYTQVANRLIELGCVQAVALDGGGSTTLGVTFPAEDTFSILNKPSGGSQRLVSNCLFLVTKAACTWQADSLYVKTDSDLVYTGGQVQVSATPVDGNGYAVSSAVASNWTSDGGTFSSDGQGNTVFTAGGTTGNFQIAADYNGVQGSSSVRVVDQLSSLTVTQKGSGAALSSLSLKPGDSVEFDVSAVWYNLPVTIQASNVSWRTENGVGTIDGNGRFVAGDESASGAIVASAGGKTVRIPVTVTRTEPFTDIAGHWSRSYVLKLYDMGLVQGIPQPDGTYQYQPDKVLTRGEVLTYISRLLGVDTSRYDGVELPFADLDQIRDWEMPYMRAMYSLGIFTGCENNGVLTAEADENLNREEILTLLGRILEEQQESDLGVIPDQNLISDWAVPYVKTLLAQGVVQSGVALGPQDDVTRGEMAMLVAQVSELPLIQI